MRIDSSTHEMIQFKNLVPVRFTDIDRYGHVATAHYVEYLFTSRFDYLRDHFQLLPDVFRERGVGFVTRRMQMEFLRPIPASQGQVAIESAVPLAEDTKFIVDFKISHPDGELVHAQGTMDFRAIDLRKGGSCPVPDWLLRCFFVMPE